MFKQIQTFWEVFGQIGVSDVRAVTEKRKLLSWDQNGDLRNLGGGGRMTPVLNQPNSQTVSSVSSSQEWEHPDAFHNEVERNIQASADQPAFKPEAKEEKQRHNHGEAIQSQLLHFTRLVIGLNENRPVLNVFLIVQLTKKKGSGFWDRETTGVLSDLEMQVTLTCWMLWLQLRDALDGARYFSGITLNEFRYLSRLHSGVCMFRFNFLRELERHAHAHTYTYTHTLTLVRSVRVPKDHKHPSIQMGFTQHLEATHSLANPSSPLYRYHSNIASSSSLRELDAGSHNQLLAATGQFRGGGNSISSRLDLTSSFPVSRRGSIIADLEVTLLDHPDAQCIFTQRLLHSGLDRHFPGFTPSVTPCA